MRTLLALILSALLPAHGKRRASTRPALSPAARPAPIPHPGGVVGADHLPLVRPYLIHWEQQRGHRLPHGRRGTAVQASIGRDMSVTA